MGELFQNILPAIYGKYITNTSDVDVTAQIELLGLPIFEKWYICDGTSGRKYWIKDETRKNEAQLKNWIWNQLTGTAQVIIRDLLHDSHTMSHNLYTFISTSDEYTMHYGKFDSNQSWKLIS